MAKLIIFIDKVIRKISTLWRERIFRNTIKKSGRGLHIYGPIYLINRNITVGNNVKIYPGVQFFGDGDIRIGNDVSIGNNVMIYASASGGVDIGNNTIIAAQSYIVDMNHGMAKDQLIRKQNTTADPIIIGDDVWIGANATILKGSKIGEGAIIGAKALVNKNVNPYDIVVGVPCRVISRRE